MAGLVERKLSKSALWCQRLAVFAVPYFLMTIVLHRLENITSYQAIGLLAFGFVILVVAVMLAIRAFVHLWNDGSKGGKKMIFGLFLSILMLAPFFYFGILAVRYPAINDVSTNVYAPPQFGSKTLALRNSRGGERMNDVDAGYDDDEITTILYAYPKISPRRYPAGPERVFSAVNSVIKDRGWHITEIRGLPDNDEDKPDPVDSDASKKKSKKSKPPKNEDQGLEASNVQDILLDVVYTTLIFSFKNDVVIKIISEEKNTLVEVRSAGRWGVHDFGENARLIEKFMRDLDKNLIGIAGEG